MAWYATYDDATGALVTAGAGPADTPVPGQAVALFAEAPAAGATWNAQRRAYDAPPPTKTVLEQAALLPSWTAWWRWKTTLDEVAARNQATPGSVPAAVVTALQQKANAAWASYVVEIQAWRQAS